MRSLGKLILLLILIFSFLIILKLFVKDFSSYLILGSLFLLSMLMVLFYFRVQARLKSIYSKLDMSIQYNKEIINLFEILSIHLDRENDYGK